MVQRVRSAIVFDYLVEGRFVGGEYATNSLTISRPFDYLVEGRFVGGPHRPVKQGPSW